MSAPVSNVSRSLTDLPDDLLPGVLEYLSSREMVRLGVSSRKLNELISGRVLEEIIACRRPIGYALTGNQEMDKSLKEHAEKRNSDCRALIGKFSEVRSFREAPTNAEKLRALSRAVMGSLACFSLGFNVSGYYEFADRRDEKAVFVEACRSGDLRLVKHYATEPELISLGLMEAIPAGQLEVINYLLPLVDDERLNSRDFLSIAMEGKELGRRAASRNEVIEVLLKSNRICTDVQRDSYNGWGIIAKKKGLHSALTIAAEQNDWSCVHVILSYSLPSQKILEDVRDRIKGMEDGVNRDAVLARLNQEIGEDKISYFELD